MSALPYDSPEEEDLILELRELWVTATHDTVSRHHARAIELADKVVGPHAETAQRYVKALARLERWLHDR